MMATPTIPVRELLRGCTPGRLQSVGLMQLIPLRSDLQDDRFVSPDEGRVSTAGYGNLVINNPAPRALLVPTGATYIVSQAAQNHALPHAGFVKAQEIKRYETALCVQQSQGGYINEGRHPMMLLPFPLREPAHRVRREVSFGRLWGAIAAFNQSAGLSGDQTRGHLEYFFDHFREQLDTFVAQFEPVPQQVGCIVLVGGKVVGIERTPSTAYFRSVFRALVRECYGSLALLEAAHQATPAPPRTRVPLRPAASRADLLAALAEAEAEEFKRVCTLVDNVLGVELKRQTEEEGELTVDALGDHPFVGQVIRDGEKIVYASLIATEQWRHSDDWLLASPFQMAAETS
jgi:hypothetical protein